MWKNDLPVALALVLAGAFMPASSLAVPAADDASVPDALAMLKGIGSGVMLENAARVSRAEVLRQPIVNCTPLGCTLLESYCPKPLSCPEGTVPVFGDCVSTEAVQDDEESGEHPLADTTCVRIKIGPVEVEHCKDWDAQASASHVGADSLACHYPRPIRPDWPRPCHDWPRPLGPGCPWDAFGPLGISCG